MATWRYYAQRILSGEWLDRDLELYEVNITWALSGPGSLTAKVDPILASQRAQDGLLVLEEWSTAIYAEADGEIRWGGLLHSSTQEEGGVRALECIGFAGYPKGRIYDSDQYRLWEADPFDIVRTLWAFVQSDAFGDLGVTVDDDVCPVTIGDPSPGPIPVRADYPDNASFQAALTSWTNYAGTPYELAWWNQQDCGNEIDNVIAEADAEYLELHWWDDDDKEVVRHHISLGWPAVGTRRMDLRFMEGENIVLPPYPQRSGDAYASQILALGNGEERHMLRQTAGFSQEGRLRRDKVVGAQDVMSFNRLKRIAEDALAASRDMLYFDTFEVINHPNAPFGAWTVGDEVRVQTFSGFEDLNHWVLVTELQMNPENNDIATVTVSRI